MKNRKFPIVLPLRHNDYYCFRAITSGHFQMPSFDMILSITCKQLCILLFYLMYVRSIFHVIVSFSNYLFNCCLSSWNISVPHFCFPGIIWKQRLHIYLTISIFHQIRSLFHCSKSQDKHLYNMTFPYTSLGQIPRNFWVKMHAYFMTLYFLLFFKTNIT